MGSMSLGGQEPYFQSDLPPQEDVTDAPDVFLFSLFFNRE